MPKRLQLLQVGRMMLQHLQNQTRFSVLSIFKMWFVIFVHQLVDWGLLFSLLVVNSSVREWETQQGGYHGNHNGSFLSSCTVQTSTRRCVFWVFKDLLELQAEAFLLECSGVLDQDVLLQFGSVFMMWHLLHSFSQVCFTAEQVWEIFIK